MASIGELTATVRADIQGYVGPMRQVVATNQQVAASTASAVTPIAQAGATMTAAGVQGANWTKVLERVEHVSTLVGAETLGLGTHFGRLAAQLGPLVGAGGVFALVAAGIAAISFAFTKATEAADHQREVVADLKKEYEDATGATVRLRKEEAALALQRELQGHLNITSIGPGGIPIITPTFDTAAIKDANLALEQATKDLHDWTEEAHRPNVRRAEEALRAQARAAHELQQAMQALKDKGAEIEQIDAKKADALSQQTARWYQLKQAMVEANLAGEKLLQGKVNDSAKGDNSLKEMLKTSSHDMREVAQSAAQGFASAFGNALRGQTQGLLESIASVLKDAILGAIDKLISEKIFEALMRAFTSSKGGGSGTGGFISDIGGAVLGAFGAPSVPMAGALAGGGTVVVSGRTIPPALSPVQHARDQQWQALLIESNRVAEANGAKWRYVSR